MTNPYGNVQNLNEESAKPSKTALNSAAQEATKNGGKPSPELIRNISDKLAQLLGEDAVEGFIQKQNGTREVLNEDGLPIIDINEPLANDDSGVLESALPIDERELVPLASLPLPERERLRRERDRILDLLEEEERQEQERSEKLELEQRQDAIQKRKEAVTDETNKLKAAKDLQKKMGKALLRNMSETGEMEEKAKKEATILEKGIEAPRPTSNPEKSVTFADSTEESSRFGDRYHSKALNGNLNLDWGDVEPARLRSTNRPMKLSVVERIPASNAGLAKSAVDNRDSDDESPLGSPLPTDSDEGDIGYSYGEDHDSHHSDTHEADEEPVLEDEYDLNSARHQREIALEYYRKRESVGEAMSKALMSDPHTVVEGNRNNPIVSSEANLSGTAPKPAISRFKASRIALSNDSSLPASTSLGTTAILPASSTSTLQRAIRSGKLDAYGRLVGGDAGESDSEEKNETIQGTLAMLRTGESYNLGPDVNHLHSAMPDNQELPISVRSSSSSQTISTKPQNNTKFKLARSQAKRPSFPVPVSPMPPATSSPSNTSISNTSRSSPKSITSSTVIERSSSPRLGPSGSSNSSQTKPSSISLESFITERPYEPRLQNKPTLKTGSPSIGSEPSSAVVDSPSFPANPALIPLATSERSTIIDSPLFPPDQRRTRRPDRPPMVMASTVRESDPRKLPRESAVSEHKALGVGSERKLSRFLAERV